MTVDKHLPDTCKDCEHADECGRGPIRAHCRRILKPNIVVETAQPILLSTNGAVDHEVLAALGQLADFIEQHVESNVDPDAVPNPSKSVH